ncbi:MAG: UDP-N-acetylglucosamine 1-carboxyvinyltransferase [Actinomycetota bacterium]|nr:UDP-N-acetylglucosamine 1-carboxyvinyltransferase [Actinomycetota bacterium]
MNCLSIEGGNRLDGRVAISGAKNSALKLMAASLLARGHTVLYNVPRISDVFTMVEMLERLGASVSFDEDVLWIDTTGDLSTEAPYDLVRRMRASINVLGPLLARCGHARVAMPGGCNIGNRAIDMHEAALNQLGVTFAFDHGYLEGIAPRLQGKRVVLEFPSRGATENLLTASVLAEGVTTIENAAREPDIIDLANFLNAMGARVEGAGTSTIRATGVTELSSADHRVSPDPIEAGTLALATLVTGGEVELVGARAADMDMFLEKVVRSGAHWESTDSGIYLSIDRRPKATDFATLPYPGFPTDLQPQMMAYLSVAEGTSIITENVFESRFQHVSELARMGADIRVEGHHAVVKGVAGLQGAPVHAPDLRGGAALVIAALAADGRTEIHDFFHVERGYEDLPGKLRALGAGVDGRSYVGRRRFKPLQY